MRTILLLAVNESPAFKAIAASILPLAKGRNWAVHVIAVGGNAANATKLISTWNPDGCILYAPSVEGIANITTRLRIPTILVSPTFSTRKTAVVAHDSRATGELAAHELAKLGFDHFAFAAATTDVAWVNKRLTGFKAVLGRCGRRVDIFEGGNLRNWLKSLPKPCGLFAANDMMAERSVSAATAAGIDIPFDLAVLGCDDDSRICEHAEITISSIRPDYTRCGMLTVESLASAMEGKRVASPQLFGDVGVTNRASTRLIAWRRPEISAALEYIRANALSGITAADVLVQIKGSRRSAENAFRTATGRSILEEIQAVRIDEVKRLLANPFVKIGAIAARTGYGSENFLTRLFKRKTGLTPSQWRHATLHAQRH